MTAIHNFRDLLLHEVKDLYSAEKQLVKALPKMAKAASHDSLRTAFENHLEETKGHVERLEQILEMLDVSARGPKCEAMEGLIREASTLLKEDVDPVLLDAALICAAQRVEHYEIAAYGCARTFAEHLGEGEVAAILQTTLDEESAANELLTQIAEESVNVDAFAASADHR